MLPRRSAHSPPNFANDPEWIAWRDKLKKTLESLLMPTLQIAVDRRARDLQLANSEEERLKAEDDYAKIRKEIDTAAMKRFQFYSAKEREKFMEYQELGRKWTPPVNAVEVVYTLPSWFLENEYPHTQTRGGDGPQKDSLFRDTSPAGHDARVDHDGGKKEGNGAPGMGPNAEQNDGETSAVGGDSAIPDVEENNDVQPGEENVDRRAQFTMLRGLERRLRQEYVQFAKKKQQVWLQAEEISRREMELTALKTELEERAVRIAQEEQLSVYKQEVFQRKAAELTAREEQTNKRLRDVEIRETLVNEAEQEVESRAMDMEEREAELVASLQEQVREQIQEGTDAMNRQLREVELAIEEREVEISKQQEALSCRQQQLDQHEQKVGAHEVEMRKWEGRLRAEAEDLQEQKDEHQKKARTVDFWLDKRREGLDEREKSLRRKEEVAFRRNEFLDQEAERARVEKERLQLRENELTSRAEALERRSVEIGSVEEKVARWMSELKASIPSSSSFAISSSEYNLYPQIGIDSTFQRQSFGFRANGSPFGLDAPIEFPVDRLSRTTQSVLQGATAFNIFGGNFTSVGGDMHHGRIRTTSQPTDAELARMTIANRNNTHSLVPAVP